MDKAQVIFFLVISTIVLLCFIGGIIYFIFSFKNRRKVHLIEKEELINKHKNEILQAQLEVQQQTMDYIGREIHDNVGQKLTLASLLSQQLHLSTKDNRINNIIQAVNEGLQDLRSLSKSLTSTSLQESSFLELLEIEAKNVELLKKQNFILNASPEFIITSPQTKLILIRIVQEFIQNSLKHSHCKNITITLSKTNETLKIKLQDDGIGFNTSEKPAGIGLSNMQKRAAIINADFQITSSPKNGTSVTLTLNNNAHEA